MTLPSGVLTATVTFGPYMDDAGAPRSGTVVFRTSSKRVWTATGEVIMPRALSVTLNGSGAGSIVLPATDQPGFSDGAGNSVTDWTYTADIKLSGSNSDRRTFMLPTGGVDDLTVDLDLLTPVTSTTGTTVALPSVLSVDGEVGVVDTDAATAARVGDAETATGAAVSEAIGAAPSRRYGSLGGRRLVCIVSGRTAAFATVTTSVPQGSETSIPLAERNYSTAFGYSTNGITIPSDAIPRNQYRIAWRMKFTGSTAGGREARLFINGSAAVAAQGYGDNITVEGSVIRTLLPGDVLTLRAWSTSTGASVAADSATAVTLSVEQVNTSPVAQMLTGNCGGSAIPDSPRDINATWLGTATWADLAGGGLASGSFATWVAANPDKTVDIGCPLIPTTLGTAFSTLLDEVIAGTRDSTFTTLGTNLATHGTATVYARLWWEFNLNTMNPDTTKFINAWNRVVPLIRAAFATAARSGQVLKIVWCFAGQSQDPAPWWPTSSNVDVISVDTYAMKYSAGSTPSASVVLDEIGRNFMQLVSLGSIKGKPIAVSEWAGVAVNTGSNGMGNWYGRGDFPELMDFFFDWAENAGVAYALYYNLSAGAVGQTMADTPLSQVRYQARTNPLAPA